MKPRIILVLIVLLFIQIVGCSSKNTVSFVTIFDKNNADKGGYYINGYLVNIDYETVQKLHMKKIKITGNVEIVKGLKYDKPSEDIRQGIYEDTKHIFKPVIKILN